MTHLHNGLFKYSLSETQSIVQITSLELKLILMPKMRHIHMALRFSHRRVFVPSVKLSLQLLPYNSFKYLMCDGKYVPLHE